MAKSERGEKRGETPGEDEGAEGASPTLFDNMAEDTYVLVKRRNLRTQMWEHCFRLAPGDANEDVIQEIAGGGTYNLTEKVRSEASGKWVYGRSRTVSILGEQRPVDLSKVPGALGKAPEPGTGVAKAATEEGAARPVGGTSTNMSSIIEAGVIDLFAQMQNLNKINAMMMMKAVESLTRPPSGGQNDKMMDLLIAMVANKVEGSGAETMRLAKEIAESMAANKGGKPHGILDSLEELRAIREAGDLLGGGGSEGDTWMSIAKPFAPILADALRGGTRQLATSPTRKQIASGAEGPSVIHSIRPYIPQLITLAKAQRDPSMYAQVALDALPAAARGPLTKFLAQGREGAMTKWWAAFPETTAHREWFLLYAEALATGLGTPWRHSSVEDLVTPPEAGPKLVTESPKEPGL